MQKENTTPTLADAISAAKPAAEQIATDWVQSELFKQGLHNKARELAGLNHIDKTPENLKTIEDFILQQLPEFTTKDIELICFARETGAEHLRGEDMIQHFRDHFSEYVQSHREELFALFCFSAYVNDFVTDLEKGQKNAAKTFADTISAAKQTVEQIATDWVQNSAKTFVDAISAEKPAAEQIATDWVQSELFQQDLHSKARKFAGFHQIDKTPENLKTIEDFILQQLPAIATDDLELFYFAQETGAEHLRGEDMIQHFRDHFGEHVRTYEEELFAILCFSVKTYDFVTDLEKAQENTAKTTSSF